VIHPLSPLESYRITKNRARAPNTMLWELCTMIPISALR
jgi:hypothetical protein